MVQWTHFDADGCTMNIPVGCVSNISCISFLVMSGRYHALDRRLRWVFALNVVSLGSVYSSNRKEGGLMIRKQHAMKIRGVWRAES